MERYYPLIGPIIIMKVGSLIWAGWSVKLHHHGYGGERYRRLRGAKRCVVVVSSGCTWDLIQEINIPAISIGVFSTYPSLIASTMDRNFDIICLPYYCYVLSL